MLKSTATPVQLDRPQDGLARQRHLAELVGITEHEEVGGDAVAQQGGGDPVGIEEVGRVFATGALQRRFHRFGRNFRSGFWVKSPFMVCWIFTMAVVSPRLSLDRLSTTTAVIMSQASKQIGRPGGDPDRMQVLGLFRQTDMGDDGAVLLGQADLVEDGDAFVFQMGGHTEQGADGDYTCAADTR